MYVIAVYDVEAKRTVKMLKLCRQYLHWIQNSVFEGEINEAQLLELKYKASRILIGERDSFIIFKNRSTKWMEREVLGFEKGDVDQYL